MKAQLWILSTSDGKNEARGALFVQKFEDHFVVHVKLPTAPTRYKLTFRVALPSAPNVLHEHNLMYSIIATDQCPNLISSWSSALRDRFGFAMQTLTAQMQGIMIMSPMEYEVRAGCVYFLISFDPASQWRAAEFTQLPGDAPLRPVGTKLFSNRLGNAKYADGVGRHDQREGRGSGNSARAKARRIRKSHSNSVKSHSSEVVCAIGTMQERLGTELAGIVQDAPDEIHVDISVLHFNGGTQRYAMRLQQRRDFMNLYEYVAFFSDQDVACRVEMFLHLPTDKLEIPRRAEYCPLKIGEWIIVRSDDDRNA
mmetsp:Transcript_72570/g.201269  ORF Transcript_72570/g.201269 Transcript_72570/m.201269 type:complete len:311 (-) Transcript_72570:41-973(-)